LRGANLRLNKTQFIIIACEKVLVQRVKSTLSLYLKLIRWDKPIGTLLLLWPTLWALWLAGGGFPGWKLLIIFGLGTLLMRSAGCAVNDVADRKFDAHVQRTAQRVVATGQVSAREALWVAAVCALVAGVLALGLNAFALWLCIPAAAVAAAYPFFKRFFAVPQAILGVAFSFGIPMAYAAVLNTLPIQMWLLFVANFAWVMAYDTAYAMVDKPDDLKLGLKTSAVFFGKYDALAVAVFEVLFLSLFATILLRSGAGWAAWLGWAGGAAYTVYLTPQVFKKQTTALQTHRNACFKVFLANSHVGAALWLGLVVDAALRGV
jgi:4-hydroxybenzoate polyprenyltransferase